MSGDCDEEIQRKWKRLTLSTPHSASGVLLDIHGVLYESGDNGTNERYALPGAIEAVKRLESAGVPVRYCTNGSQKTCQVFAEILNEMGFEIPADHIFSPLPAICHVLRERKLRPHLLVMPDVVEEFSEFDKSDPNCVVLGDCATGFSYERMNEAFQALMAMQTPCLLATSKGKYYSTKGGLSLDVGAFMAALEYACDVKAEVIGKPSEAFFTGAADDMGLTPDKVVMVGDDVVHDIGGAQACGAIGVLVRTGKYRKSDERRVDVQPDHVVDDVSMAVDLILDGKGPK